MRIECSGSSATFTLGASLLLLMSSTTSADEFTEQVAPFTKAYCVSCHNNKTAKGGLNLSRYENTSQVVGDFRHWNNVIEFIRDGEMPPEKAKQPSISEREAVIKSLEAILLTEARKHAGDPGVVPPRRLSNTEFDLSVRDLTGVDIRPTYDFPPDPAGGEGFDNTGEALAMSPNLLKKYLTASQRVANHLVLKTNGVQFSPFPVTSYNERKKLTEQAIIDFYRQHDVRLADYLEAAWQYRHRSAEQQSITVNEWAHQSKLSGKYLSRLSKTLAGARREVGYLQQIGERWDAIPGPNAAGSMPVELKQLEQYIEFCKRQLFDVNENLIRPNAGTWPIGQLDMRAKKAAMRDRFDPSRLKSETSLRFDKLRGPRNEREAGVKVLALRIDQASGSAGDVFVIVHRPIFSKNGNPPRSANDEKKHDAVTLKVFLEQHAPEVAKKLSFGKHPKGDEIDPSSFVVNAPALIEIPFTDDLREKVNDRHLHVRCELDSRHSAAGVVHVQHATGKPLDDPFGRDVQVLAHASNPSTSKLIESNNRFCQTFPNRFFYVHDQRGLAAGFHLVEGFFRDDQPLVTKVLDEEHVKELDDLWRELHFVTQSVETLLRGFVWFERSEREVLHDKRFDFLRPEDPALVTDALLGRFERVYLERLGVRLKEYKLEPENPDSKFDMIHAFFDSIRSGLKHRNELLKQAEQHGLRDLEALAARAYHRPLTAGDKATFRTLYKAMRSQGQGVEASLRGVLTAVLMSPDFCFRYTQTPTEPGRSRLSDYELASRLSYFLWSSIPDEALLDAAAKNQLHNDDVLLDQTRRMLKDARVNSFAREFFGQWLRFRDYLSKDPINAATFPGYDDSLRQAIFEEPTRVASFLIRNDRPVTDLLTTDQTFVNEKLAKHYGGKIFDQFRQQQSAWLETQRSAGLSSAQIDTKSKTVWHNVNGLKEAGRGGLFGMGVILTKNSAGERTSPVKRGFWTVHHLLGKHFPPPPVDVPELPPGEKQATKTIRELIAEHTADAKCSICHTHFDSIGLAMEGFDPIGRIRTKDLAGRPIDNVATLPNGQTAKGIPDLIDYIEQHRRDDFIKTMCRKFLGYALGRSVLLSDQPLLQKMQRELEQNNYRFHVLFETVVSSPQFQMQRGRSTAQDN